ncbi:hypothetical protein J4219_05915 [Candidatus Woesearchaeota archaeon]|nr:hypothetical protein [Candidatus Woesearchaeota archaeon]
MISVYLNGPQWFLGVAGAIEAFAALIIFIVAFLAARIYRVTNERKYLSFSLSFILLSLSFLVKSITDCILSGTLVPLAEKMQTTIFFAGYVGHIFLALAAYTILLVITHKIEDKRVIALIFALLLPALLLSGSYFISFYTISIILLGFVTFAYFQNFRNVCSASSCLVFLAFALLTLSQAQFLMQRMGDIWYIAGNITQAAAFLTMLIALARVLIVPRANRKSHKK